MQPLFFSNYWEQLEARLEIRLFARLYDIYSTHFDYECCGFGTKSQLEKTMSKKGIAKSEVMNATDVVHCYTLETSYHKGVKDPNRYKKDALKDISLEDGIPVKHFMYSLRPEDFEEVGGSLRHAVLELVGLHPCSIIPQTIYENMENVKQDVINKMGDSKRRSSSVSVQHKKFALDDNVDDDDRD